MIGGSRTLKNSLLVNLKYVWISCLRCSNFEIFTLLLWEMVGMRFDAVVDEQADQDAEEDQVA